jgi:hypothetical protein
MLLTSETSSRKEMPMRIIGSILGRVAQIQFGFDEPIE